jgi:hypothetical protein
MADDDKKKKRAVVLAESKPKDEGRDTSFVEEGENLKRFFQRTEPDTEVEVIPFYGQEELAQARSRLQDSPDVFMFGHSGGQMGGVEHDQIANMLQEDGIKNCFMGSCSFEKYSEPYKSLQNFNYRSEGSWYGVNPKSDNVLHAMFSKSYTGNENDYYGAGIVNPEQGKQYNRIFNRPTEKPIDFDRKDLIRFKPLGSLMD